MPRTATAVRLAVVGDVAFDQKRLCRTGKRHVLRYRQDLDGAMLPAAVAGVYCGESLLLVVHHLAVDGVSWRIIASDLSYLWTMRTTDLPLPATSFRRWAAKLTRTDRTAELAQWREGRRCPILCSVLRPATRVAATATLPPSCHRRPPRRC